MAHRPEHPQQYVCTECQVIHAGTVTGHEAGTHQYEAPGTCGACEASSFVTIEDWPHHQE